MAKLQSPSHIWLWNRIVELELHSASICPGMVQAILIVCEPNYTKALRSIACPTINMVMHDGIMDHAERVLASGMEIDGY